MHEEDESNIALRMVSTAAGLLALRICVMQLLADRLREQDNPEDALRTSEDKVQQLLVAATSVEGTDGSLVKELAVERLEKLTGAVRLMLIEQR
jgi:hypothetical protein